MIELRFNAIELLVERSQVQLEVRRLRYLEWNARVTRRETRFLRDSIAIARSISVTRSKLKGTMLMNYRNAKDSSFVN